MTLLVSVNVSDSVSVRDCNGVVWMVTVRPALISSEGEGGGVRVVLVVAVIVRVMLGVVVRVLVRPAVTPTRL